MSSTVNLGKQAILLGYYGKVPTHGDFVGKGLPRSFREPWDAWVQEVLSTSRRQMGQDWIQHYLTCPVYRFALSGGICGEQAWLGVIIPCVDQVGRYYPMTLCRSLIACPNLLEAVPNNLAWFEQAEALVLSCLEDGFSLETFDQRVQAMEKELNGRMAADDDEPTSLQRNVQKYPGAAWHLELSDLKHLKQVFPGLLNMLLQDFCFTYSLWWTRGRENNRPSLVLSKGLPPFGGTAAMLDGEWSQWGWVNQHRVAMAGMGD
jgi:type VI secretion system protein ImpM